MELHTVALMNAPAESHYERCRLDPDLIDLNGGGQVRRIGHAESVCHRWPTSMLRSPCTETNPGPRMSNP